MRRLLILTLVLASCTSSPTTPATPRASAGATPATQPAPRASAPPGEWKLLRFLGGPPADGQITDTVVLDPAAGRHVRIGRNRAGRPRDTSCEAEALDDAAWVDLVAALADPDLASAFAHPETVPRLIIDAGYFSCTHGGAGIAVSDAAGDTTKESSAVRRLASAYQRVHDELVALPACAGL